MQVLNAFESECVAGGSLNPTARNITIFTISTAVAGGFLMGDIGGVILFGVTGLIASMALTAISDEQFVDFWYQNAIKSRVF